MKEMLLVKHLLLLVLSYNFLTDSTSQGLPFNDSPIIFISVENHAPSLTDVRFELHKRDKTSKIRKRKHYEMR